MKKELLSTILNNEKNVKNNSNLSDYNKNLIEEKIGNFPPIKTQSIRYLGSKNKINPLILNIVMRLKNVNTILDACSGSTRVSQALVLSKYNVYSNDISEISYVLAHCYLKTTKTQDFYQKLIDNLNNLKPISGWYTKNYGGDISDEKKIWQLKNTKKLDAIRTEIDNLFSKGKIDLQDKYVLITSLMLALDKVENTMGHQTSYLKKWAKRSFNDIFLEVPEYIQKNTLKKIDVFKKDIKELIKENKIEYDLFYFDPPYGSNNKVAPTSRVRYNQYYHLWKTIVLNDKPDLFGKANRRLDSMQKYSYNPYEDYKKDFDGKLIAEKEILEVIDLAKCKYVLMSYNNNSVVPIENLVSHFKKKKYKYKIYYFEYKKNAMAYAVNESDYSNLKNRKNFETLILVTK